jgi:hypothetical protein
MQSDEVLGHVKQMEQYPACCCPHPFAAYG